MDLQTRLTHQFATGSYECAICYAAIKPTQLTWNCGQCYHAFHFKCAQTWATTLLDQAAAANPTAPTPWRCPAGCQATQPAVPKTAMCFCGSHPQSRSQASWIAPHACGNVCNRPLPGCEHACLAVCHPGPCRPCTFLKPTTCACGKTPLTQPCGADPPVCEQICGKTLGCGAHPCDAPCHLGPCLPCPITYTEVCRCGRASRSVACGEQRDAADPWVCATVCAFPFRCGHHTCPEVCHAVLATDTPHDDRCDRDPDRLTTCPCGKTPTHALPPREDCEAPRPSCGQPCERPLACGHACDAPCHDGPCPTCPRQQERDCRCGAHRLTLACAVLVATRDPETASGAAVPEDALLCDDVCRVKLPCKRHVCNTRCCATADHTCPQLCGRKLACKRGHTCTHPCGHTGPCHPCYEGVIFHERVCHCGETRLHPPIPCGTRLNCRHPCARPRDCGHPNMGDHPCHGLHPDEMLGTDDVEEAPGDTECPPCMAFVARPCACGKRTSTTTPCSRASSRISCGLFCDQRLPCGHRDRTICHAGACDPAACKAPCGRTRAVCDHRCTQPCHGVDRCPEDAPCEVLIRVSCRCGSHVSAQPVRCGAMAGDVGHSDDLLECNELCAKRRQTQALADAL
ncbi:hypothetical protein CXG81DRAFT_15022, partial [Caulochytrium protostelioides]